MSINPFSIRLSESMTEVINSLASTLKKTPSDIIRDALDKSELNSFNFNARVAGLMANKEDFVRDLAHSVLFTDNEHLKRDITREEISAFMHFMHNAYQVKAGYVSPRYIVELMEIMRELAFEARTNGIDFNEGFCISRLCEHTIGLTFDEAVNLVKKTATSEAHSASSVEMWMRPLTPISNVIQEFSDDALRSIFTEKRLKFLFPILISTTKVVENNLEFSYQGKPDAFEVGYFKFVFHPGYFSLQASVSGTSYFFKPSSLSTLLTFIEDDNIYDYAHEVDIKTKGFNLSFNHVNVEIREDNAYKLTLSIGEFNELRNHLSRMFFTKGLWIEEFKQHQLINGHI